MQWGTLITLLVQGPVAGACTALLALVPRWHLGVTAGACNLLTHWVTASQLQIWLWPNVCYNLWFIFQHNDTVVFIRVWQNNWLGVYIFLSLLIGFFRACFSFCEFNPVPGLGIADQWILSCIAVKLDKLQAINSMPGCWNCINICIPSPPEYIFLWACLSTWPQSIN